MAESLIPLERAWNSWDAELPARLVFPALGLRITPCAYAASTGSLTRFPMAARPRLQSHDLDGGVIELGLHHAGTELAWRWQKSDPFAVRGEWRAVKLGEWGLRFWVLLCLELDAGPPFGSSQWWVDPANGDLVAAAGPRRIVVRGERPALLTTFHDSPEALERELAEKGYFYLGSRGVAGRLAVLRYQLDEMPSFRFAAAIADRQDLAGEMAAAALAAPARELPALHRGRSAGALDAVRDVMAWNQVLDPVRRRPYVTATRAWLGPKFGSFCLWVTDSLLNALMTGLLDVGIARETLAALLGEATPAGNLPGLSTERDVWVDRSQPPIGAFVLWMIHRRSGARDLLAAAFRPLLAQHEWWWRERDGNRNGLLEHGSSPVGEGLYRGTKMAAKDDSSMDNAPIHDEATFMAESQTLDCEDVGLNSLVALDGEILALIAATLGEQAIADRLAARADGLRRRIAETLWDAGRGVFANRLWSGKFVQALSPTSFYPLLCGAASREQAAALAKLLADPAKFGGPWLLPSVARDDPSFKDNVYWRGRIWPVLTFLVYHGLRRYGLDAEATRLAENAERLFAAEWAERRCPENYNSETGAALDQPDTDGFYAWGALMPLLAVAEITDVTPWGGWEVTHDPARPVRLGPLLTPAGTTVLESADGALTLWIDGRVRLRTDLPGRLRHLHVAADRIALQLPPVPAGGATLECHGVAGRDVLLCLIGNRIQEPQVTPEGVRIALSASGEPATFTLLTRVAAGTGLRSVP
ncbi:MAG: trehalase family glycosidase [Dongiaceae bacterium]